MADSFKAKQITSLTEKTSMADTDIVPVGNAGTSTLRRVKWANILAAIYPVGSIYMSGSDISPASLFGGAWERLKDRFLLAAGDSYAAGSTGGEASHTLTTNEMPRHSHSASTNSTGDHSHYVNAKGTDDEAKNYGLYDGGGFSGRCLVGGGNYRSSSNGAHSHSVTVNNTGGSVAHNNMPPYLAVYAWKRVA